MNTCWRDGKKIDLPCSRLTDARHTRTLTKSCARWRRDGYVSWMGSRYSVPWSYAGKEVWVQDRGASIEMRYGASALPNMRRLRHVIRSPDMSTITAFRSATNFPEKR